MINDFKNFVNEEVSKNDPIPEITRIDNKLGIILLGAPGSGKSTFANNFILPRNPNIKKFSTDEVSLLHTRDPKKYHVGSSELNISRLETFIKNGKNFIYDTTGAQDKNVFNICKLSEENGYKIIFIQILTDLETSKRQNMERGISGGHQVDDDYIDFVYSRQFQNIKDYSEHLHPENFYIVFNRNKKYKFFKYQNGKLFRRKVDKYIPVNEKFDIIEKGNGNENIQFLWDFFIELKDDGLNVDIGYVTQVGRTKKDDIKDICVKISDPLEICGHVYVSLEHKKPVADILKRLSSIGHAPKYVYWSEYNKELELKFKIQN